MLAVILVGHGSLRPASGAAMIRLAARAQEAAVAPLVAAGFLNYSQPSFITTLDRCVAKGATTLVLLPYFLVPGKFVRVDLPRLLRQAQARYPQLRFLLAAPFGAHPALAQLVLRRAVAALPPQADQHPALLLVAHGSPNPAANQPIETVTTWVREAQVYPGVLLSFLGLNEPDMPTALDTLVAAGHRQIVVVPYLLQLGGHVAEDLPAHLSAAQLRHPGVTFVLAEHLAYDPLLVTIIAERVAAVVAEQAVAVHPGS